MLDFIRKMANENPDAETTDAEGLDNQQTMASKPNALGQMGDNTTVPNENGDGMTDGYGQPLDNTQAQANLNNVPDQQSNRKPPSVQMANATTSGIPSNVNEANANAESNLDNSPDINTYNKSDNPDYVAGAKGDTNTAKLPKKFNFKNNFEG